MGAASGLVIFVLILIIFGLILYYNPSLKNQLFAALHMNSSLLNIGGSATSYFIESGLPSGFTWSVNLSGTVKSSTTDIIKFTNLASKTYSFTIPNATNQSNCKTGESYYIYSPSPSSGNIVGGENQTVSFTFTAKQSCP
jgi:hypothetical protein